MFLFLMAPGAMGQTLQAGEALAQGINVQLSEAGLDALADALPALIPTDDLVIDDVSDESGLGCLGYSYALRNLFLDLQILGASISAEPGELVLDVDLNMSVNDPADPFTMELAAICLIDEACDGHVLPFDMSLLGAPDPGGGGQARRPDADGEHRHPRDQPRSDLGRAAGRVRPTGSRGGAELVRDVLLRSDPGAVRGHPDRTDRRAVGRWPGRAVPARDAGGRRRQRRPQAAARGGDHHRRGDGDGPGHPVRGGGPSVCRGLRSRGDPAVGWPSAVERLAPRRDPHRRQPVPGHGGSSPVRLLAGGPAVPGAERRGGHRSGGPGPGHHPAGPDRRRGLRRDVPRGRSAEPPHRSAAAPTGHGDRRQRSHHGDRRISGSTSSPSSTAA